MDISESELHQIFLNGYAQVETLVRPQVVSPKSCGLKPNRNRPYRLMARFSALEKEIVLAKAKTVALSTHEYIRASVLGSAYRPPINPELHKLLLALNRELTAQGRNFNQIAKHLNSNTVTPDQGAAMLDCIRMPLVRALLAVKNALSQTAPQP